MARLVAADARGRLIASAGADLERLSVEVPSGALRQREADPKGVVGRVRQLLWDRVGLVRDAAGLTDAVHRLEGLAREAEATRSRPARNAVLVARAASPFNAIALQAHEPRRLIGDGGVQ